MYKFDRMARSENFGMSTVITHIAYGEQAEEALQAAVNETERLEGLLSRFVPNSDISRINSSAGIGCEKISSEAYEVLAKAIDFSKCSEGRFDVTISPLVGLWASAKKELMLPGESKIRSILPLVDYTGLVLKPCEETAGLKKAGQSIDLGGIGKGYAADKVLEILKKFKITSAFTNFGGNVAAIGAKPDGSPWRIGIQHPRRENCLIGAVSVVNRSVVTSGDYQRFFTGNDGKRYHHLLDPNTGYPSDSGLISTTVVAGSSVMADALSTILFLSGIRKGMAILERYPGCEAIFIDREQRLSITEGLMGCFQACEGAKTKIIA